MSRIKSRAAIVLLILPAIAGCQSVGSRVHDAAPSEPAVARLFGEPITRADLEAAAEAQSTSPEVALRRMIGEVILRFRKQVGIHASDQEVRELSDRFRALGIYGDDDFDLDRDDLPSDHPMSIRRRYRQMILTWKTDKALYERYGGDVIFQQANPMEPVGAYQAFLKEEQRKGAFAIYDDELREAFWHYYRLPRNALPPEDVDFSRPWWEQIDSANE